MKVELLVVLLSGLSVAACGMIEPLGSSSGTGASTTGAGGTTSTVGGSSCAVDPETSATLCLANSACPGITIDSEVYPNCGFVVNGSVVNIECSCSGFLCPLGATSCANATTMLAAENYGVVCAQVSAGTCTEGTPSSGTTSSSSGSSSCDTTCRDQCAGEPTCLQACGC